MKAETCSCYVLAINYILCNKVVLDCKFIHFINYWKHSGDVIWYDRIRYDILYVMIYCGTCNWVDTGWQ